MVADLLANVKHMIPSLRLFWITGHICFERYQLQKITKYTFNVCVWSDGRFDWQWMSSCFPWSIEIFKSKRNVQTFFFRLHVQIINTAVGNLNAEMASNPFETIREGFEHTKHYKNELNNWNGDFFFQE